MLAKQLPEVRFFKEKLLEEASRRSPLKKLIEEAHRKSSSKKLIEEKRPELPRRRIAAIVASCHGHHPHQRG
jgi:hypothetical protein